MTDNDQSVRDTPPIVELVFLLSKRPWKFDSLNIRIPFSSEDAIRRGLDELVKKGVVAVANKYFWIRDKEKAKVILNGIA